MWSLFSLKLIILHYLVFEPVCTWILEITFPKSVFVYIPTVGLCAGSIFKAGLSFTVGRTLKQLANRFLQNLLTVWWLFSRFLAKFFPWALLSIFVFLFAASDLYHFVAIVYFTWPSQLLKFLKLQGYTYIYAPDKHV